MMIETVWDINTAVPYHTAPDVTGLLWHIVDGDMLYPVMIGRIREALTIDRAMREHYPGVATTAPLYIPAELLPPPFIPRKRVRDLLTFALQLPDESWDDALTPREKFMDIPHGLSFDLLRTLNVAQPDMDRVMRLKRRALALRVAFGWWNMAFTVRNGGGNRRIINGKQYRM